MYRVYRHYRTGQELELETKNLTEALDYCNICELSGDNGHAVSVWNDNGCIYEVNYYGNTEVDIDECATPEELAAIKSHIISEGLHWDSNLDERISKSK